MTRAPRSIVRAVESRADLRRFIDYPYRRHAADLHWIPPLRLSEAERLSPKHNPFFAHADIALLLAWRDGVVVGRIAAIDDRLHLQAHGDNVAMFGFFEAADDDAAQPLLEAVDAWARARGRVAVRGPINPSLNESAGLLVDGFDTDPMVLMPHNPPEYATYIEAAGYTKIKDLFAWIRDLDREMPPGIVRAAAKVRAREHIVVRPLKLAEFEREIEGLREIYCGAWERNWGFVAPTPEEFTRIVKELRPIFDVNCAVCAEVNGRMIACAIAVPDINQALKGTSGRLFPTALFRLLGRRWTVNQIRLLLLGVLAEYRNKGIYPLLLAELHRQIVTNTRYRKIEFSWVLENNRPINHAAEMVGGRHYQTYRIYQKALV